MQYLNNKLKLFEFMSQGATLITPNNRLSNTLLSDYFEHLPDATVTKPICLPYDSALTRAFQHLLFQRPQQHHPSLLSPAALQHMWRVLLKADSRITFTEGLLQAVLKAWEYCQHWCLEAHHPSFQYTAQTEIFQHWWQALMQKMQHLGCISASQLVPYLIEADSDWFCGPLIWVCFDEFTPQQVQLQDFLSAKGLNHYAYDLAAQNCEPEVLAAADEPGEYQQLCAWLQVQLDQGKKRIGVVILDLQDQSRYVQRVLETHFAETVYDLSLGRSLSEFLLIDHALAWLSINHNKLQHHEIALLLQSPYLGGAKEEFLRRSQFLQDSKLMQEPLVSLERLQQELALTAPHLAELLQTLNPYPAKASIEEWIELFQNRLNTLGFPGDYGLHSENFQCYNRFSALFDEFRQLALISPQLDSTEALYEFTQLCKHTIFQAQKTNAPIQISGLLEASGCTFDSLWIMGLSDNCLPQKTQLSAFIPASIQKQLSMPHSTPAKELHFAQSTLQRLQCGSQELVCSYPRLQGDNPNLPSSLISSYKPYTCLSPLDKVITPSHLETLTETYCLTRQENENLTGGTYLLANQAKCPFKAFAEHRLHAKAAATTQEGLDPLEKGQIIHKVMEILWKHLGSQEQLLQISTQALTELIEKAIYITLKPVSAQHPESFGQLVNSIETTRLKRLVHACLEWEKQREPFAIAALEASYSIQLAGLEFKVRLDRLDQVDNNKWVIDYKSSLPSHKPWTQDRPYEPQLLLYALLDEAINTIIFLQVKSGHISCSGLSEDKLALSGISSPKKDSTWQDYKDTWLMQLTHLAQEFQQGHCPPKPVDGNLCRHCDFQNLCRFQAHVLADEPTKVC